jgi:L-fucose mutarotase
MEADDRSPATPIHQGVLEVAARHHPKPLDFQLISRPDFYEEAKSCLLIVQCLENAPYSCFIAQKGTV